MARGRSLSTESVMEKAAEMARTAGIDAVTYNGLARELGIRPQSMYRYVPDIRQLRVALLGGFLTELVNTLRLAVCDLPPGEALQTFALALYDACHEKAWYYETFTLMHRYEIIPELSNQLSALTGIVQEQMQLLIPDKRTADRYSQFYMALNLGYAQMAMTQFIPPAMRDDRADFETSIREFIGIIPGNENRP